MFKSTLPQAALAHCASALLCRAARESETGTNYPQDTTDHALLQAQ
jgi:hypothetical protein